MDANFREEAWRRAFLEAATRWGVPGGLLLCQAEPEVVRERLASRRDDASDADWTVYLKAVETWEEPGPRTRSALQTVSTGGSVEGALSQAADALRLWDAFRLRGAVSARVRAGRAGAEGEPPWRMESSWRRSDAIPGSRHRL